MIKESHNGYENWNILHDGTEMAELYLGEHTFWYMLRPLQTGLEENAVAFLSEQWSSFSFYLCFHLFEGILSRSLLGVSSSLHDSNKE